MYTTKENNIIIRTTQIRVNQICEKCKMQIDKNSNVILKQIKKSRKSYLRKYYHINCYQEENT